MKTSIKTILAAFAAISTMASCQKNLTGNEAEESGTPCQLTVSLSGLGTPGTKVVGAQLANEEKIKSVQIFVFKSENGKLDGSLYVDGLNVSKEWTGNSKIQCTYGNREVFALVNAPANYVEGAFAITSKAALLNLTTSLGDNAPDAFVMAGNNPVTEFRQPEVSVTISVKRICAAVVLKSVTNDIYMPAYQKTGMLKITGAYLMNLPNLQNLNFAQNQRSASSVDDWLAKNGKAVEDKVKALTVDSYDSAVQTVAYGQSLSVASSFYAYPNELETESSENWAKCSTYLVVEANIDGTDCVYPIKLNKLQSNCKYEVSLTIHRLGSKPDEPWREVKFSDVTPIITVTDWTPGNPVNAVI